jgi:hypothetical protein
MSEVTFHANGEISGTDDYADKRIAELKAINAELEKASSYSLLKQNEKLKADQRRLREALSEIREIYTGSEGIPNPETAAEAYVLRLVQEMYRTAVEALQESGNGQS